MRLTLLAVAVILGFLSLTAVSCGPAKCGPALCPTGCCNAAGICESGGENAACGTAGNACVNCIDSGLVCGNKACVSLSGTGGGAATGGGSATGGGGGTTGGGSATGGGMATGGGGTCTRTNVECSDQAIMGLDLKSNVATGGITTAADGTGFLSTIDSRGGGFTPTESYVYAKFTATGLEKVAISDMTGLDSMDWDIAFRRFIIRVNSGDSGPGCVAAEGQTVGSYDAITAVPANYLPTGEDFLTRAPECQFIDDGSGLTTSPRTALAQFYAYTTCVAMTNRPFVLTTMSGRHVKLVVNTYYATEAGQTACNMSGSSGGALGGTIRMRWAYLD